VFAFTRPQTRIPRAQLTPKKKPPNPVAFTLPQLTLPRSTPR